VHPGVHPGEVHAGVQPLHLLLLRLPPAAPRLPHPRTHPLLPQDLPPRVTPHPPRPKEKFIFVYFNNETSSSDYYFEFKYILTLLPLRLVENLQDFILVKPYFYIKAHDYVGLGSINKIFSQRYRTLENCRELCAHLKIEEKDFVSFVPEEISAEFPKNIKRRPSLINYRFNLQGQNLTESQRNEKNEF